MTCCNFYWNCIESVDQIGGTFLFLSFSLNAYRLKIEASGSVTADEQGMIILLLHHISHTSFVYHLKGNNDTGIPK